MQQTHAVFGELANYSSEPFILLSALKSRPKVIIYSEKTSWLFQPQSGYPGCIQAKETEGLLWLETN